MKYQVSSNEQSFWISALSNRTAIAVLSVEHGQQSMHILAERIADRYLNVPRGKRSTSCMPVYNPQDESMWPELLGWLVKVGEMVEVDR
jgi:hypothetical protein